MLSESIAQLASEHRDGIIKEYKKRMTVKEKREEEERKRIEMSRKLRQETEKKDEEKRLEELKAKINDQIVTKGAQIEDPTMAKISDLLVGDKEKHIYTLGGLLGEIILVLTQVNETLGMANPEFKMTPEVMENLIRSITDTFGKSEANIELHLLKEYNFEELISRGNIPEITEALSYDSMVGPGLKYLFMKLSKFGINSDLVNSFLVSLIKFKHKKALETTNLIPEVLDTHIKDLPEEEKGPEKEKIAKQNEEIKKQNEENKKKNEEIDKENKLVAQAQGKIKIIGKEELPERGQMCAIIQLGPLSGSPNPGSGPSAALDASADPSKKGQKSQASLLVQKHLAVANAVDDLRIFILHKCNLNLFISL